MRILLRYSHERPFDIHLLTKSPSSSNRHKSRRSDYPRSYPRPAKAAIKRAILTRIRRDRGDKDDRNGEESRRSGGSCYKAEHNRSGLRIAYNDSRLFVGKTLYAVSELSAECSS